MLIYYYYYYYDKNNFHKKLQFCEGGTILKYANYVFKTLIDTICMRYIIWKILFDQKKKKEKAFLQLQLIHSEIS